MRAAVLLVALELVGCGGSVAPAADVGDLDASDDSSASDAADALDDSNASDAPDAPDACATTLVSACLWVYRPGIGCVNDCTCEVVDAGPSCAFDAGTE